MADSDLSPAEAAELDEPLLSDVQSLVEAEETQQDAQVVAVGWRAWLKADHSDNPLVHTSGFIFGQARARAQNPGRRWAGCAQAPPSR